MDVGRKESLFGLRARIIKLLASLELPPLQIPRKDVGIRSHNEKSTSEMKPCGVSTVPAKLEFLPGKRNRLLGSTEEKKKKKAIPSKVKQAQVEKQGWSCEIFSQLR